MLRSLQTLLPTLFCLLVTASAQAQTKCALTIVAEGVRNSTGRVGFVLFDSAEAWPKNFERAHARHAVEAEMGDVEWTFEDVPAGRYAAIVLHDENANRKLDRSALGKPKEGFGMTNNVKPKFGPPKFAAAAFEHGCSSRISVSLRY